MFSTRICLMAFSWTQWSCKLWGQTPEDRYPSHHIILKGHDVDLTYLLMVITPFSLPHCLCHTKEVTEHTSHLKKSNYIPFPWGWSIFNCFFFSEIKLHHLSSSFAPSSSFPLPSLKPLSRPSTLKLIAYFCLAIFATHIWLVQSVFVVCVYVVSRMTTVHWKTIKRAPPWDRLTLLPAVSSCL